MISVFDIYSIGIGPSSSHTVGPMRAAKKFMIELCAKKLDKEADLILVELYGSLALTGRGHGTDKALILGFLGENPKTIDIEKIDSKIQQVKSDKKITTKNSSITFDPDQHILYHREECLPEHPNGMCFIASKDGKEIYKKIYFSVGGGFIAGPRQMKKKIGEGSPKVPYPFVSGQDLLDIGKKHGLSIAQIVLENEKVFRTEKQIKKELLTIWKVMNECINRGVRSEGILPGGLRVKRRAPELYKTFKSKTHSGGYDPLMALDWVNLYALAVNEENAAGGKVVTAPTNGAAGIIPAVLKYYEKFHPESEEEHVVDFLLTAGAIAILYKYNASISGADVGCQGEVGVACSMAAAGLAQVLGGSVEQVENAAEIAMEHNLGLTCDPVGGLVQVPCIERNAMGAVKAINAARIALRGDGKHFVSLDKVIKTMYDTGKDMKSKYKETSRGGLAVNIIEC